VKTTCFPSYILVKSAGSLVCLMNEHRMERMLANRRARARAPFGTISRAYKGPKGNARNELGIIVSRSFRQASSNALLVDCSYE